MGFALAAAVVLDAFVVRMVLMPATLYLLGEKAWWIPRWLDRVLPDVDVEGEKLDRSGSPGVGGPAGASDRSNALQTAST
jgi:putative drug exporter of the RND superfamily